MLDKLFTRNVKDLLELIADINYQAEDYFTTTKKDDSVIFEFKNLPPVKYFCCYEDKKNCYEFTKNGITYQVMQTLNAENPVNEDFRKSVYSFIFGEEIFALYENIEELSKPNHYTGYEIKIITKEGRGI